MSDIPKFPSPIDRRTYGAFRTPEEALEEGYNLISLLNGIPYGYHLGIFYRFGAYILVSYPKSY